MKIDFIKLCEQYKDEAILSLQDWIRINSIFDETTVTKEKPFGEGVYEALKYIADLAEKSGFTVDRCDNYCTEISFGEGQLISVYAHADVVPVSGEWKFPPFSATIDDGKMFGRGTSDDKGPAMAAFYALKALKDNNLIKNYKVNLVIGGNEESGSLCLEHYFHKMKKPYPKYGFTPDGDFPLIYGEKGISNYKVEEDIDLKNIISIHGGTASNCVIDEATCILKDDGRINSIVGKYFNALSIKFKLTSLEDNVYSLTVYGKAAHGSMPTLGINAGLCLLKFLGIYEHIPFLEKTACNYFDGCGEQMGLYEESELLHGTTFNLGVLDYKDSKLTYIVNYRYPETTNVEETIEKLNELELGKVTLLGSSNHLLMDPNSDMVKTLLKVYQNQTGDTEHLPITIGGGTYARESKNTVAFGSAFPNSNDHIHDKNERIELKDFTTSISIYAEAIYQLGNLK